MNITAHLVICNLLRQTLRNECVGPLGRKRGGACGAGLPSYHCAVILPVRGWGSHMGFLFSFMIYFILLGKSYVITACVNLSSCENVEDLIFLLALLLLAPEIQWLEFLSRSFSHIHRKSCLDITWMIQVSLLRYK